MQGMQLLQWWQTRPDYPLLPSVEAVQVQFFCSRATAYRYIAHCREFAEHTSRTEALRGFDRTANHLGGLAA